MKKLLVSVCLLSTVLYSCVPAKKYQEALAKQKKCEEEAGILKNSNRDLETELTENKALVRDFQKKISHLEGDTATTGKSIRALNTNYEKLSETYEMLLKKNKELLAGSAAESAKLSGQLQITQEQLQKKEDALKIMERELDLKGSNLEKLEANLDKLQANLEKLNEELQVREKRVNELETILKNKEDAVKELRAKVSAALLGFEGNGLTVEQKNGKVYVSLEEQLLFASGSTKIESKGVEALKNLAKVLEQNTDINVLIEGHTDDVPMSGAGVIKDNWDLSVMRATSIVKILLQNKNIDPKRLLAAGRGEFMPINPEKTPEARKKNRRTEIILTPKFDELLQLLEDN